MTLAEKNALIHSRVMRQPLDVVCSGPTAEHPDTPHRWRCRACGKSDVWGSVTVHTMGPPNYFEDMNAAMHLLDNASPLVGTSVLLRRGTRYAAIVKDYPGQYQDTINDSKNCMAEALCLAILLALGVTDHAGRLLDEGGKAVPAPVAEK